MNSGMEVKKVEKVEVGKCGCCGEYRHLGTILVPVVELHLVMMSKLFIKTGGNKEFLLCGICADKAQTGGLSVLGSGEFILNGKHYSDILKQEKDRNARLW